MTRRRRQLPSGTHSATVYGLSHEGRGIAQLNGKTTFIHNALPDEIVAFTYHHCSRSFDEGTATQVQQSSQHRIEPICVHYNVCGGCQLQHMDIGLQLQHKQKILIEQLNHFGRVTPKTLLPILSGQSTRYRHKARLGVRFVEKKGQRVLIGFRERNGRYLADLHVCEVLHPSIGQKLPELSALLQRLSGFAHIPQLEIAVGGDSAAIVIRHMTPLTPEDLEQLSVFSQTHQIDIYSHPNSPQKITKLFPQNQQERLHYCLPKHQLKIHFHPTDFTQINEEMNRLMIDRALELLELQPNETLLDLFCGIGNFSLAIARYAKWVVGVDGTETAVERAKENALHNGLDNTEFFCADLSKDCASQPWHQRQYDKILLDPSRAGAEEIIKTLATLGAKTIVYVSCNPASLARDVGILVNQLGYTLESAGIMNMFPHTAHVESIALLKYYPCPRPLKSVNDFSPEMCTLSAR